MSVAFVGAKVFLILVMVPWPNSIIYVLTSTWSSFSFTDPSLLCPLHVHALPSEEILHVSQTFSCCAQITFKMHLYFSVWVAY